ncbi:MAG: SUMF1/EgtB/PvdO family nonheme iron enzyme [Candidatus Aureabacteria bacterium]|nr:SUMF1/EgtB/PvdO family nonheme iron enzyme [Candidatus Auribacterota bacterium]
MKRFPFPLVVILAALFCFQDSYAQPAATAWSMFKSNARRTGPSAVEVSHSDTLVWSSTPTITPTPVALTWVYIGDAGNSDDDTGYGGVNYGYYIAKYEITYSQYCEFLNAVAATDSHGLYDENMGSLYGPWCGITRSGSNENYTYSVIPGRGDRPVCWVDWYDAARFCNWLHNGKESGCTENGAYNFADGDSKDPRGYDDDLANDPVTHEPGALFWIPTANEWYKAAYYSPAGTYYDYPTGSDMKPIAEAPPGGQNSANWLREDEPVYGPPGTEDVGSYINSPSPYGTYDQCANIDEFIEDKGVDGTRIAVGCGWDSGCAAYANAYWEDYPYGGSPWGGGVELGFRVASSIGYIPAPTPNYINLSVSPASISPGGLITLSYSCDFSMVDYRNRQFDVYLAAVRSPIVPDAPSSVADVLAGSEIYIFSPNMSGAYLYKGMVDQPTFSKVTIPPVSTSGNLMLTAPPVSGFSANWAFAVALFYSQAGPVRSDLPMENSNLFKLH